MHARAVPSQAHALSLRSPLFVPSPDALFLIAVQSLALVQYDHAQDLDLPLWSTPPSSSAFMPLRQSSLSRFGSLGFVESEGRSFPVSVSHESATPLAMSAARPREAAGAAADATVAALRKYAGDVLVFLPGEAEIREAASAIERAVGTTANADSDSAVCVLPLYGAMPAEAQQAAVAPDPRGRRRVVIATNIAESSLTIKGVRVV
eukprot:6209403-Pleurochrysis_carterae.AAC.1